MTATSRDLECDVLVAGSGGGGLAAAVTAAKCGLDVIVIEKAATFGGTTARSGGVLWVPGNPVSRAAGIADDTREAARTYLQHETGNFFDAARIDAFLDRGPEMVAFFERETAVRFDAVNAFSDYHPNAPGARPGGRSILAAPFDGRQLGARLKDLSPPLREITIVGMMINTSREVQHFFNVTRSLESAAYVARRLLAHAGEVALNGRATRLTNGNALVARLAKSAFDAGVRMLLAAPLVELVVETGRVQGAIVGGTSARRTIIARRGVVLACGGFPHDATRRAKLFPHDPSGTTHLSPQAPGNTGDGLSLAASAGALLQEDLPNAAAWIPVSKVTHRDGTVGVFPHLIDRYKPGIIAVTRHGLRFTNESNSYHDMGQAMLAACRDEPEVAAWLVADTRAIARYGLGFAKPFPLPLGPHLRSGYLLQGRTTKELAARAGIDGAALAQTIETYNDGARLGRDPAFGRGTTAYNRFLGDPRVAPNPCVAPLDQPPYYAVKIVLGDLGTFAGIATDADARVLDRERRPIAGLYAVGNDAASIMGGNYPGGGITLGPAMTFGYIAGRHLAGRA